MLEESISHFLSGDIDTGKTMLRDYINAKVYLVLSPRDLIGIVE